MLPVLKDGLCTYLNSVMEPPSSLDPLTERPNDGLGSAFSPRTAGEAEATSEGENWMLNLSSN